MRIAKEIYKTKKAKTLDEKMANRMAIELAGAVAEGWSSPVNITHQYSAPGTIQYRSLMDNVWQFSFAKNHQQLKATTLALLDDKGDIVSFDEFEQTARRINNGFQTTYLRTEYDTAVGGAVMADKWAQYQADAEALPYLEYITAGDKRVRPAHEKLDGTVLPITDDFWRKYYPPNGWNCRCDVIQSLKNPTLANKVYIPTNKEVPRLFQTNLGESGLAFPKDHPYYKHLPDEVLKVAKSQNPFEYPKTYEGKKGGFVRVNPLHGKGELEGNMRVSKILANIGEEVFLLPDVNVNEFINKDTAEIIKDTWAEKLRKLILPNDIGVSKAEKGKLNADAVVNGKTFEFKISLGKSKNTLQDVIRKSIKQAPNLVFKLEGELTDQQVLNVIKGVFNNPKGQPARIPDEVWIIDQKNKLKKYSGKDLLNL